MIQGARGWCTGMTQRDGIRKEVGGGFRMGNTCTPVADSCQCMAKPIQYCKVISLQLNKFLKNFKNMLILLQKEKKKKRLSFVEWLAPWSKIICPNIQELISGLLFCYIDLYSCVYASITLFDYHSFVVRIEFRMCEFSSFVVFPIIVFWFFGLCWNSIWILGWVYLILWAISLGFK